MSHFTVLVIGNDPEKLLAPFDEGIQVEPYEDEELNPQDAVDWAKKCLTDPETIARRREPLTPEEDARYRRIAALDVSDETQAREALAWFGDSRFIRKPDGRYVRLSTYNPESKWDWYSLGGRWRGSLKVTPEAWDRMTRKHIDGMGEVSWVFEPQFNQGRSHTDEPLWVDQCRRGDLDLEGMTAKKVGTGETAITRLVEFIAEHGSPPSAEWMDAVDRQELTGDALNVARTAFWQDPWVKAFDEAARIAQKSGEEADAVGLGLSMGWGWWELDDFRLVTENVDGRNRYLELCRARAIPGYALLDEEHGWMEPGRMGWFGTSSDTAQSRIGFYEARLAIMSHLEPDALLSVYDCHI